MPSVETYARGRLPRILAQERLAKRICLIGESVRPSLGAQARIIDMTLPWPVLIRVPETEGEFAEIGDVHISGAELTLIDSRHDWHRFPFTFIRAVGRDHLALPDMTGTLVMIEDHEECRLYRSPRIQSAQCFLRTTTAQNLRYELEPEFDLLMAYVRYFFMPDLEYWRHRTLGHYTEYRRWIEELKAVPRGSRSVQGAITRWVELAKWPPLTEWDRCGLDGEAQKRLEGEGTVEGIATGALIALLRRVDPKRPG